MSNSKRLGESWGEFCRRRLIEDFFNSLKWTFVVTGIATLVIVPVFAHYNALFLVPGFFVIIWKLVLAGIAIGALWLLYCVLIKAGDWFQAGWDGCKKASNEIRASGRKCHETAKDIARFFHGIISGNYQDGPMTV